MTTESAHSANAMKVTPARVVLPFYLYAALAFLACTILLFFSRENFISHYFHPHTLAITHLAALGWGTMIIIGASHQLVPVITGHHLHSERLVMASFILSAIGIPLLVFAFYTLDMGAFAKWGGRLVLLSVICYVVNLVGTVMKAGAPDVHSAFMITSGFWLLLTVALGLALVYNFTYDFLPRESLSYLPLHAHTGIVGWFLLLVIGVGSRLIPMFLISKYTNKKLLWLIFFLVNAGLLSFIIIFLFYKSLPAYLIPASIILLGLASFGYYCVRAFRSRIRKKVDDQLKISLLSVAMMAIPLVVLALILSWSFTGDSSPRIVLVYGFVIFFGWLTAIILGMTFKTLPFIIWNRIYNEQAGLHPTPTPNELFSHPIFRLMCLGYLAGFILFIAGILVQSVGLLALASALLMISAVFYNWNVIKLFIHKFPAR